MLLPNTRFLLRAKAIHRAPLSPSPPLSTTTTRTLTTTSTLLKWEGSTPKDHVANEPDTHNVRHDAAQEGFAERRKGDGNGSSSRGTSEKAGESTRKAKEEFPEAPDTIGMQDERGGKE